MYIRVRNVIYLDEVAYGLDMVSQLFRFVEEFLIIILVNANCSETRHFYAVDNRKVGTSFWEKCLIVNGIKLGRKTYHVDQVV